MSKNNTYSFSNNQDYSEYIETIIMTHGKKLVVIPFNFL